MRARFIISAAAAAAASGLILAPVSSAAGESALLTIGQLEAQGFHVQVDRLGSAPLSDCEVRDIRNPQDQREFVRVDRRGGRDRVLPVVVRRTITVSLDCSRR